MEGIMEKESEVKTNYRNLSPVRPVIHKLKDHLKVRHSKLFILVDWIEIGHSITFKRRM